MLVGLLALAPFPVLAAKDGVGEYYVELATIVLEFWDANGVFHSVVMDLLVAFPGSTTINKKVVDQISMALTSMTWEEFSKDNPAATVKSVALSVLRKDPTTEKALEVLVAKLVLR